MNRQTWVALALVATVGVCAAVGLWAFNSVGVTTSTVENRVIERSSPSPDPAAIARVEPAPPSTSPRSAPAPAPAPAPPRAAIDALSPHLDQSFDDAMNTSLQRPSGSAGASDREIENAMQQQLLAVTGEVVSAAEAHTEFAKKAPRREADAAVDRAAMLYDHLASTIDESPMPPGLSDPEQAVFQTMLERMASKHARKAAALRAQGVSR